MCFRAEGTLNLDYCLSHIYAWKESKPMKQEDDRDNVKVWQILQVCCKQFKILKLDMRSVHVLQQTQAWESTKCSYPRGHEDGIFELEGIH